MSLLQDKHFEDLDFISQAVEPFYHPAMELFKNLPSEILISTEQLKDIVKERYSNEKSLDEYKLEQKIKDTVSSIHGVDEFNSLCSNFYDVEIDGLLYDVHDDVLIGQVILKKKTDCPLTQELISSEIRRVIGDAFRSYDRVHSSKKELLDLSYLFLGNEETGKLIADGMRPKELYYSITRRLQEVLCGKDSKYRIRGLDAAEKLSKNFTMFLNGSGHTEKAMANLTLFKMVMDKGNAVYSLQEVI